MSFPIEKSGDVKKWMKRKRTRRHCNINSISQPPPPAPVVTSSTSSSADFSGITTEEEEIDLANSLILLSQGGNSKDQVVVGTLSDTTTSQPPPPPPPVKIEKIEKSEKTHKSTQPNNGNNNEHTCKTCFKRFNSFQALGGHRASHKKPKLASDDHQKKKAQSPPSADTNATSGVNLKLDDHDHITTNYKEEEIIQVDSKIGKKSPGKVRVHACQICHAEFSTGQALGGHMRRHKPLNGGGALDLSKNKKDRSGGLELDLNFPPSDQDETVQPTEEVFPFEGDPPTKLLLGSSALTNCSLY